MTVKIRERVITVKFMMAALVMVLLLVALGVVFLNKDRAAAATCPCNVFTLTPTPGTFNQPGGIEVGFKFKSSIDGYISGVRFFKTSNMGNDHTVSLWNNTGQRIVQATSTAETAIGWQEVNFTPVAITSNTIYTASVFMQDGQYNANSSYYTSDIINGNLTAPRSGAAYDANGMGGQGVYNDSGTSSYPISSFNAANYWVDVAFIGSPDSNPPEITAVAPDNGASDALIGKTVSATFDRPMDAASISSNTFSVKDASDTVVTGMVSYDSTTKRASFVTPEGLEPGKTYTATLKGGVGTVVQSIDGVPLAEDYTWTFSTEAEDSCPCTLMDGANPAGSQTFNEPSTDLELGVKVVPEGNGYLQSLRFYKPIVNDEATHTGHVWDKNGAQLASVTFTNESEYGWQEARFDNPIRVYEGEPYVLSYGTSEAIYTSSIGKLNDSLGSNGIIAHSTGNPLNAASGSGNSNGAFSLTTGSYPSSPSNNASYYWIDTVFTHQADQMKPLEAEVAQPTDGSYGVARTVRPSVTFNRQIDASTVTVSSVQLLQGGSSVGGTPSYDAAKKAVIFTPDEPLSPEQAYTLRINTTLADVSGVALENAYETSFTVGTEHVASTTEGYGGPVLVITTASDLYGQYYAEILRTEGVTYFDVTDISDVSAELLRGYKIVIIAEMTLTQQQINIISKLGN